MVKGAFRSDMLRKIYNEALTQGWTPVKGSGHVYLRCPKRDCHYREAFSMSGRGMRPETDRKISFMRRHGFVWKGKKAEHTADPLDADRKKRDVNF